MMASRLRECLDYCNLTSPSKQTSIPTPATSHRSNACAITP